MHLLSERSIPHHINRIKIHPHLSLNGFCHKHFWNDFYHFAFTFIWLYVIHLIYGWLRFLSTHCTNSGIVVKGEKSKPQIIFKCNEMLTGIKFSKTWSWCNSMLWEHLIRCFINLNFADLPPYILELLSYCFNSCSTLNFFQRTWEDGSRHKLKYLMDRTPRILHKPFYSFWEKYQAQLKPTGCI